MKKFIDRPARLFVKKGKLFVLLKGKKYLIKNSEDYSKRELLDIILKELIIRRDMRRRGKITPREKKLDKADLKTFEEFEKLNRNQSKNLRLPPLSYNQGPQSFFNALTRAFANLPSDVNREVRAVKKEIIKSEPPPLEKVKSSPKHPSLSLPSSPPPIGSSSPVSPILPLPSPIDPPPGPSSTVPDPSSIPPPLEEEKAQILRSDVDKSIQEFIKKNKFKRVKDVFKNLLSTEDELKYKPKSMNDLIDFIYEKYNDDHYQIYKDLTDGTFGEYLPSQNDDDEKLQLAQTVLADQLAEGKYYRGKGLRTDEIDKMMKPYRQYIGTLPADFIHHIDIKKLPTQFGFVMNLDSSNKPGSHWVGVFIDLKDSVEYYDSFAREPSKSFLKQIKILLDKLKPNVYLKLKINRIKEQNVKSSNCGFFAMRFLTHRFDGKPFREVTRYDDSVKGERDIKRLKQKFGYI